MVRNLYPATLLYRIMVEVDIGAFVEAVVRGRVGWWGKIVMDVREAVSGVNMGVLSEFVKLTVSSKTPRPVVEALRQCDCLVRLHDLTF